VQRRIIPDVVTGQQRLTTLHRAASVCDAALAMHEQKIGAIMIVEEGRLLGIFTERDLARCIATNLDLKATPLGLVMTRDPQTIAPQETAMQALGRMQDGGFRHLPVVDGEGVIGMVSVRDLFAAVRRELEEDLRSCEAFVHGESYGVATAL
jgi:CBS domain-containing protein